jgi:hypothetical protein
VNLTFVYTVEFDRLAEGLLTDEELRLVEQQVLDNPRVGVVVRGTGGVRKLRVALPGRGKSGSARIIDLYIAIAERVYEHHPVHEECPGRPHGRTEAADADTGGALKAVHERERGR